MNPDARIYVAGHTGLVGSAICRALQARGHANLLLRTHRELDLTDQAATAGFFRQHRPEYVFLAAAVAGGIHRNKTYPGELIYVNLAIQANVIEMARRHGVKKLLFIGSACSYPKECPQPIRPEMMLTAPVESTNEPFAVAKIAGVRLCQAYNRQYGTTFLSVIPSTIYGPNDHFDENGHVVASLLARFDQARRDGLPEVVVWGTGRPRREFMYADDAADGLLFIMDNYSDGELLNLGMGEDISIAELAEEVRGVVGFTGRLAFDTTKPDGMPRRLLDASRIRQLGWQPRTPLRIGLRLTYEWYLGRRTK